MSLVSKLSSFIQFITPNCLSLWNTNAKAFMTPSVLCHNRMDILLEPSKIVEQKVGLHPFPLLCDVIYKCSLYTIFSKSWIILLSAVVQTFQTIQRYTREHHRYRFIISNFNFMQTHLNLSNSQTCS